MDERRELQVMLQGLGLRVTPQRLLILEAVHASDGHVTAEQIHQRIAAKYPYINITTVYRNLDALVGAGLITETSLGDKSLYYELAPGGRHHHLVCERCGEVRELSDTLVAPLRQAISQQYDFVARVEHLAVFGLCHACRSAAEPGAAVRSPARAPEARASGYATE